MRTQSLMFVHSEVDDAGLSMKAFRVLGHLHRRAGGGDYALPSVETIAEAIGLNVKTIKRGLAELAAAGFITRVSRRGTTTLYHLKKLSAESGAGGMSPADKGPEVKKDLAPKVTQAPNPSPGGPEIGPGVGQKTAHKDNPFKGLKEGNPPLPPPPAGGTAGLRPPPRTGPEDCATAGDQAPVPVPLRGAPGFPAAWESFCRHRRNLWRLNRTPWTRDAAASLLEKCRLHGAAAAVAAIARTVESGKWTGLYFDAGRGGNQSGFRSYGQGNGRSSSYGPRPFSTQAQARTQAPQAAAAPVPPAEDPFAESRRNRDRLRRELEGEPPPGWHEHGHDREPLNSGGEARAA